MIRLTGTIHPDRVCVIGRDPKICPNSCSFACVCMLVCVRRQTLITEVHELEVN